ncbi:hypothetical protein SteCoe_28505 [Stentor coeruleus]|uniref:Uncharacterized protein n=1 Tax=Stentor coeruleus TaxID=5963 RepID=A0A1R2B830_9CILI|nr:hypothetical protein SteCoe_28505 [Stentor coeruleus]
MNCNLGSLGNFLLVLPDLKTKASTPIKYRLTPRELKEIWPIHKVNQTPSPGLKITQKPTSLHILPKINTKSTERKLNIQSSSPLGVYEKVRKELMTDKSQKILRCMNLSVREDERRKIKAILEQRALDKVLNTMRDINIKPDTLYLKPVNRFVHNKKRALHMFLKDVRGKWMSRRELPKKLYKLIE